MRFFTSFFPHTSTWKLVRTTSQFNCLSFLARPHLKIPKRSFSFIVDKFG